MSSARLVRGSVSNPAGGAVGGPINRPNMTAPLRIPPIDLALIEHLEGIFKQPLYKGICRRDVDRMIGSAEVIEYLRGQYELQQQK